MKLAVPLALVLALAPAALPDTIVLKKGKKITNVVVSRNDGSVVVINPFHSRHPEMIWEIPEKNRIPAEKVAEVIIEDKPLVEYRRRACRLGLTAEQHLELAEFCEKHKLKQQRIRHLRLMLCEVADENVLKQLGESKWHAWAKGNPLADAELRTTEREFVTTENEADLAELWSRMRARGTTRSLAYLQRARRSAQQKRRRRDKVPLTLGGREVAGATYCLYVPDGYDPLTPTALVVGLHGGGRGGRDETLVTGSGESAMNFYMGEAEKWNWIVVCPTAVAAPWSNKANHLLLDTLLDEVRMLFNIDENRIYLTGHSMGGFGAWYWGPKKADVWAACAPCAGGGGPNGVSSKGLPVYIYHGSDDGIVGPSWDRSAAKSLLSKKKADFVYTEIGGVGHGFPAWVRNDIFRWFAGRWKDVRRKTAVEFRSSFLRKVSKVEVKAFGDPSTLSEGAEEDADLKKLVSALAKGGGAASVAADELAKRKGDAVAARSVARVLRSNRAPVDAKVYAARVLGSIAHPSVLKPLARALKADDFRIVEAATWGLGETRLPEAAPHLVKACKRLAVLYDESFYGDVINFTEYNVRLKSFDVLVEALGKVKASDDAFPALQREVIARVYLPAKDYRVAGSNDRRFRHIPPQARLRLLRAMRQLFVEFKDQRAVPVMKQIAERWRHESRLSDEALACVADIKRGDD